MIAFVPVGAGLIGLALAGCSAPPPPDSMAALESGDAAARSAWIIRTAADPDDGDVRLVVEALRSDDTSERMLAITTLEKLYGERLGYDFAGPLAEREAGAARWRARLFPRTEPSNTSP